MADRPKNPELDSRFPSGEWLGFYVQPSKSPARCRMELLLTFSEGRFSGDGIDSIGEFTIRGRYNLANGEATFHKHYVGQHSLTYHGWNEGKGIWGKWELVGGVTDKGGFHIWPRGMRNPAGEALETAREVDTPADEPVLVGDAPERGGNIEKHLSLSAFADPNFRNDLPTR